MKVQQKKKNRTFLIIGFTLIELLVVIAIIAIIASILLPVLEAAKRKAYLTGCTANLKQDSMAIQMFADDNNDILPPGQAGVNSGSGLSVGQICSFYSGSPNQNYYLYDYLYSYMGSPQPKTTTIPRPTVFVVKSLFCPADAQYNPVAQASNDESVVSYQMVEGSPTSGRGYCGLQWYPFGYNLPTAGSAEYPDPPYTMYQVSRVNSPSSIWEMVDCDLYANPGISAGSAIIPAGPQYVHKTVRNYAWFDEHVSAYTINTTSASPIYPHPYYGLNP